MSYPRYYLLLLLTCLPAWLMASTDVFDKKPPPSPENIVGVTKVDAEGVINLYDQLGNLLLVDARIPRDRDEGYIEGSISLPDIDTDCSSLKEIIPEKTSPVLFYCNGPKCGRSAHSLDIALRCGYSNLFWFRGGIEEWKIKKYPLLQ